MSYESNFSGKAAIKGAGRGIGRAIAIKLDKSEFPNIQTVADGLENGKATRDAIERLLPVDYLVKNADIYKTNPFLQVMDEEFAFAANVNLNAVINMNQTVAKKRIAAGKSVAGIKAFPMCCTHTTLKAGLGHGTEIMAIELGLKTAVADAQRTVLDDRIPPARKLVGTDEVDCTPLLLLSDVALMITGSSLVIVGLLYKLNNP